MKDSDDNKWLSFYLVEPKAANLIHTQSQSIREVLDSRLTSEVAPSSELCPSPTWLGDTLAKVNHFAGCSLFGFIEALSTLEIYYYYYYLWMQMQQTRIVYLPQDLLFFSFRGRDSRKNLAKISPSVLNLRKLTSPSSFPLARPRSRHFVQLLSACVLARRLRKQRRDKFLPSETWFNFFAS